MNRSRSEADQQVLLDLSKHYRIGIRAVAAAICNRVDVDNMKPSMKIGIRAVAAAICNQVDVDNTKPSTPKEVSVTPAAATHARRTDR